ncbi:MAG: right-handed parallel beta-helix repeat-containing protein [Candidatus Eiseniibacteriota bacterium]
MSRFRQAARFVPPLAALLGAAGATPAATFRFPDDAATIQAAIDLAQPGDTVVVACGTWNERNIVLASGVRLLGDAGGPDCVAIDGRGLGRILVVNGTDASTEVRGITFRNGFTTSHGAGIYGSNAHLTVADCRFEANVSGNWGGGIALQGTSSPVIDRCVFAGNAALYGGGIYCELGSPRVSRCRFEANTATHGGGGMQAWYPASAPTVEGCVFAGNRAIQFTGGGFAVQYGDASLAGCTFWDNDAQLGGTAMHAGASGASLVVDRCIVAGHGGPAFPVSCTVGSTVVATCTDVFGNAGGDWAGCLVGQENTAGNFTSDPLFCDAAGLDFTLMESSPCAPAGTACGLVGAEGVGCAPTALAPATWGAVKAMYRPR